MINKEGIPTIVGMALVAATLIAIGARYSLVTLLVLGGLFVILTLFSFYFFRDPQRTAPADASAVISPCDGKVIGIETAQEPEYIEDRAIKISIFMSVFNVHVNYVPFTGVVDYMRFHRGKFFKADDPRASLHNVNIMTGLATAHGKIAFKQVTGMVARRLVNNLRLGNQVQTAQKFGIIKFGSRMEVFLPLEAKVKVNLGDKVRAGETIIASFDSAKQ